MRGRTRRGLLTALCGIALASSSWAAPTGDDEDPLLGKVPPELNPEGTWLNWKGDLSLEKLRGHVVWLEFTFVH